MASRRGSWGRPLPHPAAARPGARPSPTPRCAARRGHVPPPGWVEEGRRSEPALCGEVSAGSRRAGRVPTTLEERGTPRRLARAAPSAGEGNAPGAAVWAAGRGFWVLPRRPGRGRAEDGPGPGPRPRPRSGPVRVWPLRPVPHTARATLQAGAGRCRSPVGEPDRPRHQLLVPANSPGALWALSVLGSPLSHISNHLVPPFCPLSPVPGKVRARHRRVLEAGTVGSALPVRGVGMRGCHHEGLVWRLLLQQQALGVGRDSHLAPHGGCPLFRAALLHVVRGLQLHRELKPRVLQNVNKGQDYFWLLEGNANVMKSPRRRFPLLCLLESSAESDVISWSIAKIWPTETSGEKIRLYRHRYMKCPNRHYFLCLRENFLRFFSPFQA